MRGANTRTDIATFRLNRPSGRFGGYGHGRLVGWAGEVATRQTDIATCMLNQSRGYPKNVNHDYGEPTIIISVID